MLMYCLSFMVSHKKTGPMTWSEITLHHTVTFGVPHLMCHCSHLKPFWHKSMWLIQQLVLTCTPNSYTVLSNT
uniref:(California timema) hypothetical protein n=1 Tax=Timema californicum TaxID=61474 RepID=A0A7R9J0V7_TIMCA|nr:unnamed protein product [Timema californicum]